MKQLAILALVFGVSACLASVSWGQNYYGGGHRHGGYYSGYRGSGTTFVVGVSNGFGYNGWGYGHQPYYRPSRVAYYGGFGYGTPVRHGYYRPVYSAPGCGYGRGFSGGGAYFGW